MKLDALSLAMGVVSSLAVSGVTSPIFAEGQAVRLAVFSTGNFQADYSQMVQGGEKRPVKIPIPVYMIRHPKEGIILFDSGLGQNFEGELKGWWLYRLLQRLLPCEVKPEQKAVNRLRALGIEPGEVRYIILSHLHYDHAGGLADFPRARILVSDEEWRHADTTRFKATLRGYRREQYEGLQERFEVVEYPLISEYEPFEAGVDLFGDGSLILLSTPGHTPGHQSLLIRGVEPCLNGAGPVSGTPPLTASSRQSRTAGDQWGSPVRSHPPACDILLTGDAVWVRENYQRPAPKGWLVSHLEEDYEQAWETTKRIHEYSRQHPETVIIPGHDPDIKLFW